MKVVILAAGYATRLYPLTKDKPKALLTVGDKPLLNHLMDKIEEVDFIDEVILVTNHKFYAPFSEWANGLSFSKKIEVIDDGTTSNDNRLGAIGDLQFALKKRDVNDDIMVLASDNLFEQGFDQFLKFASSNPDSCAIGVYDIKDPSIAAGRYGIIEFDDNKQIQRIEEKPQQPKTTFVSMGVYYFSKSTLSLIDQYLSSSEKQDAPGHYATWLLDKTKVFAFLFSGKWYDIGSLDQLEDASKNYVGKKG